MCLAKRVNRKRKRLRGLEANNRSCHGEWSSIAILTRKELLAIDNTGHEVTVGNGPNDLELRKLQRLDQTPSSFVRIKTKRLFCITRSPSSLTTEQIDKQMLV